MQITDAILNQLRLTKEEYDSIVTKIGKIPNFTELCTFSAMWSEHCSYKNSIKWLKKLPKTGSRVLVSAGEENAGLMDIGDGEAVVFKIESHNHPSALEPFQGAATGVGGIHRDIFTMGARPIAALNSLRFGNINNPKTQHLVKGVVEGIGHYGNCFGVATVAGEVYFDECYQTNPLVNAMSVGIVDAGKTVSAIALGKGNPVFYVGSATGKDGIGGASFASADITNESVKELPAVQVGDPFQEKKLLEACLEVLETDAVVGMQDMGAAGIICSTAEMSAKGEVGMDIYLHKVPTRLNASDTIGMKAWELLLSESQERMLMVVEKGKEKIVLDIFEKWDLPCAEIGHVTDGGMLNFYLGDVLEASVPAYELVLGGGAPQNDRPFETPKYFEEIEKFNINNIEDTTDLLSAVQTLITNSNIVSRRWVYRQYDSMLGTGNTNTNSPSDAAVISLKNSKKALALTVDCNGRYVHANPNIGTQIAVAEAARNIICSGGLPIGVTNCLNFGNPFNPEVYFQFKEAITGMGIACEKWDTPVTGGNVSFYNQGPDGAVFPTPTIGMVGLLEDINNKMSTHFKAPNHKIYLLGKVVNDIACSEYLYQQKNIKYSPAPYFNIDEEFILHQTISNLIKNKFIESAHDLSEGGLIIALFESAMTKNLGFEVSKINSDIRKDSFWMGEAQGRVIVTVNDENEASFLALLSNDILFENIGTTTKGNIIIDNEKWPDIKDWKHTYDTTLEKYLN